MFYLKSIFPNIKTSRFVNCCKKWSSRLPFTTYYCIWVHFFMVLLNLPLTFFDIQNKYRSILGTNYNILGVRGYSELRVVSWSWTGIIIVLKWRFVNLLPPSNVPNFNSMVVPRGYYKIFIWWKSCTCNNWCMSIFNSMNYFVIFYVPKSNLFVVSWT